MKKAVPIAAPSKSEHTRRIARGSSCLEDFHRGADHRAFTYFGFHRVGDRALFRVWAPHAEAVSVIGDFNQWDETADPLSPVGDRGVWETSLDSAAVTDGTFYKFCIRNGSRRLEKADPFARAAEAPPNTASVIRSCDGHVWRDGGWMRYRSGKFTRERASEQPINIYELHAGSWKRHADGSPLSYTELAAELVHYVKQMGYTHVELMPLAEYPFDGSWGYQVCGYFAPTARYGTPEELMELVDTLHEAGIGVILDWVPAHFPKDAHGLCEFDGQPLFEYAQPQRMEHPTWGTRCFDLGRPEVRSFLLSSAAYWIETYHLDGLRVDAVASMLYLDFDREMGQWTPNPSGGTTDPDAAEFFRTLNRLTAEHYPDVMLIAEESAARERLTDGEGGLGFTFKWNMGWMNDSLSYWKKTTRERGFAHRELTFSFDYAHNERFILPISHDEVVHGKRSLLDRSPGSYEEKFAGTRTYLTYMMTHPGKKLLFMGCEIGQFCEWSAERSVEWFLLDYEKHAALQYFVAELNHFYLTEPALWQLDRDPAGFALIDGDNAAQRILSYRRRAADGTELIVLLNLAPTVYDEFLLAVPEAGSYAEVFNSDAARFGGSGIENGGVHRAEPALLRGGSHAIRIKLPPLSALIFKRAADSAQG